MARPRTYLALGDRMSRGLPAEVEDASVVRQVHRFLQDFGWRLEDKTADGCRMEAVPLDEQGDLLSLVVGGHELLSDDLRATNSVDGFAAEHRALVKKLRDGSPNAPFLIANVHRPRAPLPADQEGTLAAANERIFESARAVDGALIDVAAAFRGREHLLLSSDDELSVAGASVVATLFFVELRRLGLIGP